MSFKKEAKDKLEISGNFKKDMMELNNRFLNVDVIRDWLFSIKVVSSAPKKQHTGDTE